MLPFAVTIRGVNDENINARFNKRWYSFCIILRINPCAYNVALVLIKKLHRVLFVLIIILAENKRIQLPVIIYNWQAVQLMIPNEIVRFRQRDP
ncbi:hypothetical protein D3C85_1562550 [compost metagenome]